MSLSLSQHLEPKLILMGMTRLRATGVVNVENPVTKAYQEGRIQEIPDDEDD